MDNRPPQHRRQLSPKEQKALEKQRKKQREQARKEGRAQAKYREEVRKQARKEGRDSHVVISIPADLGQKKPPKKPRKKTVPDIIRDETDKRVRDLPPTDHSDGYYVNEVAVRRAQAEKQRKKRRKAQPKQRSPKQRRVRRIIAYVSIFVCVIVIGVILSLTVLFKTENIIVKGNELYEDSTIIQLAGISEGDNIFMASINGNVDKVKKCLPYVKDAKIDFQIPDTLVVSIVHEIPYYNLQCNNKIYLISEDGRVLAEVDETEKDLMTVSVPKLKGLEIGGYITLKKNIYTTTLQEISQSLLNNGYEGVTAIDLSKISNISITYDNRIKIKLGLPEDLDYKIRTAFTIINQKLDPNNTGKIKGILNVSECNTTKKSYFSEGELKTTVPVTQATESTTETETQRAMFVTTETTETTQPTYAPTEAYVYYTTTQAPVYYGETQPVTYATTQIATESYE